MAAGGEAPPDPFPWHVLLGPLPAGATPRAAPVASSAQLAGPEVAAVANWESLVLDLSAAQRLRPRPVSIRAGGRIRDRRDPAGEHRGRFEPDGEFRGTFWLITGPEPVDEEEPRWEMSPREPAKGEVEALRQLAAEIVRRRMEP